MLVKLVGVVVLMTKLLEKELVMSVKLVEVVMLMDKLLEKELKAFTVTAELGVITPSRG